MTEMQRLLDKLDRIESKLDLIARSIGGPRLVLEYDKIEADAKVLIKNRTFSRDRVKRAAKEAK